MYALRLHDRSQPLNLIYEQAPEPVVSIGDALVRVHAASFTPTETSWPPTWVDRNGRSRVPAIPSHEVSGVVEALGDGSFGVSVGQEVYGLTDWYRDGAAAELIAVEVRNLAPKPTVLTHDEAAAVPLAGLTAWQALFDLGRLERGQRVLVHGAGGGVGTFGVQLAHAAGAYVVGTGHASARDLAGELGADEFVDVGTVRFEDVVRDIDVVFDLVGGETFERSWSVLKPGGVIVSVATDSTTTRDNGRHSTYFIVEPNRPQLAELSRRIEKRELRVIVGATTPLAEGKAAFETKQRGGKPGKAVLRVAAP
jgi:NADPH:quinone reductase-like Zn-dependent oxidoreductase